MPAATRGMDRTRNTVTGSITSTCQLRAYPNNSERFQIALYVAVWTLSPPRYSGSCLAKGVIRIGS